MISGISSVAVSASGQASSAQAPSMTACSISSNLSLQGSNSLDVFRAALIGLLMGGKDKEDDHSNLLAALLMSGLQPGSFQMEFNQTWSSTSAQPSGGITACSFSATV